MKKVLIIAGTVVLIAAAFFAGRWTAPSPMMFSGGPGGAPAGAGQVDRPFQVQGLGETISGEISAIQDSSFTVQGDEERTFEIDANTRLTNFGSLEGLKIGDTVEVVFEAESGIAIAITVMNYLGQ